MNILFIGSSGALSLLPFKTLAQSSYNISAVGVYQPIVFDAKIIALENESLALAANQAEIPIIDLSQPLDMLINYCETLAIDVILMSCYAKRLPDPLLQLPMQGCFNMHPSLLPLFRGPEPIFWQMKMAADIGVSWHRVTSEFDAGDVIAQRKVLLDDGADYQSINSELASVGSQLMLTMLAQIQSNSLTHQPQDSQIASYYPYPESEDFIIDTGASAQTLYNFMCATAAFKQAYRCQLGNNRYLLDKALDYENNDSIEDVEMQGNTLYIPCKAGVLVATFTGKI